MTAVSPISPDLCFCLWLHPFLLTPSYRTCLPTSEKHYERDCTTPCTARVESQRCHAHRELQNTSEIRPISNFVVHADTKQREGPCDNSRSPSTRTIVSNCIDDGSCALSRLMSSANHGNHKASHLQRFSRHPHTPRVLACGQEHCERSRIFNLCLASTGSHSFWTLPPLQANKPRW